MTASNVSFIGADNLVNSTETEQRALFLKIFSGEVITSFNANATAFNHQNIRNISSGKTAQFPVVGRGPGAEYHTPGAEILGQEQPQSEKTLNIDRLLITHRFLDDLDEAMSHFEIRSKYSASMGLDLALAANKHVLLEMWGAANSAATITGEDGGYAPTADGNLAYATASDADFLAAWVDGLYDVAINFDNKFITGTRKAFVKPNTYRRLAKAMSATGFSVLHRDYGVTEGSFSAGEIPPIGGIRLESTPTLPVGDFSALDYHAYNTTGLEAIVATENAVGTVKLLNLSMQTQWDIRRQGTLMVARYAMGHGVLQPECASVLTSA